MDTYKKNASRNVTGNIVFFTIIIPDKGLNLVTADLSNTTSAALPQHCKGILKHQIT